MKIAYFDSFSGASGDMILGALMDAGLPLAHLKEQLSLLNLTHWDLGLKKVVKKGISASRALVLIESEDQPHRHLSDIQTIIDASKLKPPVKKNSIRIFTRLAEAEAKIHNTSINAVHFHEVGAMDAIIDVVGAVAGLNELKIEKVFCSPLNVGSGTVECAHGTLPVPAPATAELIKGQPFYSSGIQGELLTPTGAAILTTLSEDFGPIPLMRAESIGYGAGAAERPLANLLRLFIGEFV